MLRFSALFFCAAAIGCSARNPAASAPATDDAALAALEAETGHRWTVRYHDDTHTPAFLEGRTAPMATTPQAAERAGRAFLLAHAALFHLLDPDDELVTVGADTDEVGMTHARFTQARGKIPVWQGELLVHFAADGALVRVNGRYLPLSSPPLVPARSADQARATALLDASGWRRDLAASAFTTLTPKLWLYAVSADDVHLAWRVETEISDGARPMDLETFVDALDGQVLHRDDMLAYLDGSGAGVFGDHQLLSIAERSGQYWLEDPTRGSPPQKTYSAGGKGRLPGSEIKSADPTRWDEGGMAAGAAVDAHAFVADVYDYFLRVHGRKGWDGKGSGVHATVHFGDHFANAFFNGRQLVFGDGDGGNLAPTVGALDLVAHEFTHGLTFHTVGFAAEGQPGALNEAIADLFACFVSYGRVAGGDWQIGETLQQSGPLRDLADPHATHQPATMAEYVVTSDDNGGVHANSTIVSHAAYLMTDGPSGMGVYPAQKIWYRALTRYLTQAASFADAADATIAAAKDLGGGREEVVRDAWVAVGLSSE